MRILKTGTLSGVTGATFTSAVSSATIALTKDDVNVDNAYAWVSIEGDTGRTGGSVAVFWKGCYQRTGVTYAMPATGQYFVKSGTSVTGQLANGTYMRQFVLGMPYFKVCAVASASGSTQHGTGTTNSIIVRYAIVVP